MKSILLSGKQGDGLFVLVDDDDYEHLSQLKWCLHSAGYAVRGGGSNRVYLHRQLMCPAKGFQVDHINGDKLDNRRSNLRVCTHSQNLKNQRTRSTNKSGYKGVHQAPYGNKWFAQITLNGKCSHLGTFATAEEAAIAYNKAALHYHGEYARLNVIGLES